MKVRRLKFPLLVLLLGGLFAAAIAQSPDRDPKSVERVRHIILYSRTQGAHGLGYSSRSLKALSRKLTTTDIPTLIDLAEDKELHVGVQFALASQCEAALSPVRGAVVQHKMHFLEAEDTMRLIEGFDVCSPETRDRASAMRSEIHLLGEAEQTRLAEAAKEKAADDARIQQNALKMQDPARRKELTRQEREEVYKRSLRAMGLQEDGPMTPAQRDMVQRMYRTMVLGESGVLGKSGVLGESGNRPPNQ
jgi:hypothetical protein